MANDKSGKAINNLADMIRTVKPTQLGKKQADLTVTVAKAAGNKLFHVEDGKVKIPRKRQTSEQWPQWFEELTAPRILYVFIADPSKPEEAIEVFYNEEAELFEAKDEDGTVLAQYTGDNVVEMADPDCREVNGTPEGLQQLRNAITRFNNKTGKRLATRFVKAQRDSSGRTIQQTEMVYRMQ